ncbi:testis-specific protein TSX-like isoform X2 [Peromyscus maniculatus bairdii]|uniref:Testis specific X-linked gene n=1 Tax=Peromyscus maniculatus bairdii TaxID=230844 RepID=A0A6J0EE77_PERMB|nr:testis-specific protein TSX-like isoform X2 [Peromyscus maniculatus bairdii]XP_015865329.1 testis-specific protein TSX-like isoform X2 [Peromyscus maniculatus bairdii]XP_042125238.1 testis-specific protein TSX-like isoform X2 [Peromyscus maniculatus bairdii]
MSEEQTPQTSEAECSAMEFTEFEDEERWFFEVLGIKPRPPSALDDDTEKKEEESLGHANSSLHLQDVLQENQVSSTDDSDACQAGCSEEDDETSHSDSDADDNVQVIIGDIKTNPSMYMEMLTNLKSKSKQDMEKTAPDNAMNPTD